MSSSKTKCLSLFYIQNQFNVDYLDFQFDFWNNTNSFGYLSKHWANFINLLVALLSKQSLRWVSNNKALVLALFINLAFHLVDSGNQGTLTEGEG